jgi:hypothetical protein
MTLASFHELGRADLSTLRSSSATEDGPVGQDERQLVPTMFKVPTRARKRKETPLALCLGVSAVWFPASNHRVAGCRGHPRQNQTFVWLGKRRNSARMADTLAAADPRRMPAAEIQI